MDVIELNEAIVALLKAWDIVHCGAWLPRDAEHVNQRWFLRLNWYPLEDGFLARIAPYLRRLYQTRGRQGGRYASAPKVHGVGLWAILLGFIEAPL